MKQRLLEEIKKDKTLLHLFYVIEENNRSAQEKGIVGNNFPLLHPTDKDELIKGFYPLEDVNEYFIYDNIRQELELFTSDREKVLDLVKSHVDTLKEMEIELDEEKTIDLQMKEKEEASKYYQETLAELKDKLDFNYIRNAILVYLDLAYNHNKKITDTIGIMFYLLEDFTSKALPKETLDGLKKDLLDYIREIAKAEELEETNEDLDEEKQEAIRLSNNSKLLRRYFSNNIKERLLNRSREEMLTTGSIEDPIKAISNLLLTDIEALEPSEVIEYLKIFLAQIISYSADCKLNYNTWKACDLTYIFKKNNFTFSYDLERVKKELGLFCNDATKRLKTIKPGKVNEDTKEAVIEVIKTFANEETLKTLGLDKKEYIKTNKHPINWDITEAQKILQQTNHKLLETKEETLKRLEAKKNPTRRDLLEIDDLKKKIEQENAILEEISDLETNQKELEKGYSTAHAEEKETYKRLLKDNAKKLKQTKDLVSKDTFLQLTMDENQGKLESMFLLEEGTIRAKIRQQILENNSSKGLVDLIRYIEDQVYYKYNDNFNGLILIDIDDLIDFKGLNPNSYRVLRKETRENLNIFYEETIKVKETLKNVPIDIAGDFRLITSKWDIRPKQTIEGTTNETGKEALLIRLSPEWQSILFSEKGFYWASVPRILNRQKKVAKALGYYFYEDLRRNLRGEDYRRTYKLGTIIKQLEKEGALQTNNSNRYSDRVIKPLQEALNTLEDAGLIEYTTNAFNKYDTELVGKLEDTIKRVFEEERLEIVFKKVDLEAYEKIKERNNKRLLTNKKKKTKN